MPQLLPTLSFIIWLKSSALAFVASSSLIFSLLIILSITVSLYIVAQISSMIIGKMLANKTMVTGLAFFVGYGFLLKYASYDVQEKIVVSDLSKLKYANADLQKGLALADYAKLQDASFEVQKDIIGSSIHMLQYASAALQKNIMEDMPVVMEYVSCDIKDDKEAVRMAVRKSPLALQYASERLRNDKDVVLDAVAHLGLALYCASDALKNDKEVVLAAMKTDSKALQYASYDMQKALVTENGENLQYAGKAIKNNTELVTVLAAQNIYVLEHSSPEVKEFEAAVVKYKDITMYNDISILRLMPEESSRDVLVSLLSMSSQQNYADQLNIIYTALDKPYMVTNLARRMKLVKDALHDEVKLSPLYLDKYDFSIGDSLLVQLSSLKGVQDFIQDQLLALICKGAASNNEGLEVFKTNFIAANSSPLILESEVMSLVDVDCMDLLMKLALKDLFSLRSAILIANNTDVTEIKAIVAQDAKALKYISDEMQSTVVMQDLAKLEYASNKVQREIIAARYIGLKYANLELKADKTAVLAAVKQNVHALAYADRILLGDKTFILSAINQDGLALKYASAALKNNMSVVLSALAKDKSALRYASYKIQKALIALDPARLKYVTPGLNKNINVVKKAFLADHSVLRYAHIDVQELMVAEDITRLQYVRKRIQKPMALASPVILKHASFSLQKSIIIKDPIKLQYGSEAIKNDRETVLVAVRQHGKLLRYASAELRDDKEIALAAFEQESRLLGLAGDNAQREIVAENPAALKYANADVQKAAIISDPMKLQYASEDVKNNKEVIVAAAVKSMSVLMYAGSELQADIQGSMVDFTAAAVKYSSATMKGDVLTLQLTPEEASRDMLVALSLIPNQEIDEDKLNIICAALDKPYIATGLAQQMVYDLPHIMSSKATASAAEDKFDFAIDVSLLPKLSSLDGLQYFIEEQLLVLICKGCSPSSIGALAEFRNNFMLAIEENLKLKYNVAKLLSVESTTPGLFAPRVLKNEIKKLDDKGLMNLLVRLELDNLFSLKDAILHSNIDDRLKKATQRNSN